MPGRQVIVKAGMALRATGDNEDMIRSLGVNTDNATVFGLGLSNAMVALSGALVAQDQRPLSRRPPSTTSALPLGETIAGASTWL